MVMKEGDTIELRPGFTKTCTKQGNGKLPKVGHVCTMNYHGTLDDGTVFDSTRSKKPFSFHLGHAEVIKGWDIAVETMTIGEKAIIHVPPGLAYGNNPMGPIPANSELTFELELVSTHDDTLSKIKWQLFGLLFVIVAIVIYAPGLQHGHKEHHADKDGHHFFANLWKPGGIFHEDHPGWNHKDDPDHHNAEHHQ